MPTENDFGILLPEDRDKTSSALGVCTVFLLTNQLTGFGGFYKITLEMGTTKASIEGRQSDECEGRSQDRRKE